MLIGFIVFGFLAAALTLGLAAWARRRIGRTRAGRDADRRGVTDIIESGRWLVDRGAVDLLLPTEPAQLHVNWMTVQTHAMDLETRALELARRTADLPTGTELHRLAADTAALRAALADSVALRAEGDPADASHVLAGESVIAVRRRELDFDLKRLPAFLS